MQDRMETLGNEDSPSHVGSDLARFLTELGFPEDQSSWKFGYQGSELELAMALARSTYDQRRLIGIEVSDHFEAQELLVDSIRIVDPPPTLQYPDESLPLLITGWFIRAEATWDAESDQSLESAEATFSVIGRENDRDPESRALIYYPQPSQLTSSDPSLCIMHAPSLASKRQS